MQVSYLFILLVSGRYRYTERKWFKPDVSLMDVKHRLDLQSAHKQQGGPALIFHLHFFSFK